MPETVACGRPKSEGFFVWGWPAVGVQTDQGRRGQQHNQKRHRSFSEWHLISHEAVAVFYAHYYGSPGPSGPVGGASDW